MRLKRHCAKVLFTLIASAIVLPLTFKVASAAPLFIDASVDLTKLKIADKNAIGDATTNNSAPVQAAIDYLAKNEGGGSLIFAPGVYSVGGIVVKPGVKIIGADREKTVFRANNTAVLFSMEGGELHNFTAYGTPSADVSGDNWKVGTGGVGKDGTALSLMIIRVGNAPTLIAKDVVISNVTAKESRYDILYPRGSQNLQVLNCEFDRSGRNLITMAGKDENFLISGCRFGSNWGLYFLDIEPNTDLFIRDGMFLNCVFGESRPGRFIFSNTAQTENHNIAIVGCTFIKTNVRIKGVFPDLKFLYNPQMGQFIRTSNNRIGELPNATIRGNHFGTPEQPMEDITSGVTFTGDTIFEDNTPPAVNSTKISEAQVTQE